MTPPTRLRVEHGPRLVGLGVAAPRLSWWLPDGADSSSVTEIEAAVGDGPVQRSIVEGDDTVLRPWPFDPLTSRDRVRWRVRTLSGGTWSEWSTPSEFEVGLLDRDDWVGAFIGAPGDGRAAGARGARPATYLRRRFDIVGTPRSVRLRATALGIYELHLDGVRVGDLELTPGFTSYRTHLETQTYVIDPERLAPGTHELVATVSDGWYRGSVGFTREEFSFGERTALLAQLEITDGDGMERVIASDADWEVSVDGPIRSADLIEGQRSDLRVPFPPTDGWAPASLVPVADDIELVASPAPPTRIVEGHAPRRVRRLDRTRQVIELDRNINGWLRVEGRALGPVGTEVRLTHGERLDGSGDVDMSNLVVHDFLTKESLGHGQVDEVVSGGEGRPFEPRHTTHGFQYVRVEGAPDLDAGQVSAAMVHTDLERTGWFSCSDPRLDALHDAAVLSMRGNVCEIPTDCPQRERAGWTGDWQIFASTAAYLYDIAGFNDRWLRSLAADQWSDGRVTNHVPDPVGTIGMSHPVASFLTGSAGWGDAAVIVPWISWQAYGDRALLERQYLSMVAWVEFGARSAEGRRHATREAARPTPAAHERYLWDAGFHWGEWSEPGADAAAVFAGELDQGHVATAYLHHSSTLLARAAHVLGHDGDERRFAALAARTRDAWRAEFIDADGRVVPRTQATLARALAFGLLDADETDRAVADLVGLIRTAGNHVGTGFLTTPFLLPVLADHGRVDVAYDVLLQTSPPSWLAMVDAGATTIWENWGDLDSNDGSLNHYSKGAVVTFLHRYVAGLRPIPDAVAYRRFRVRPMPGGGIDHAAARLVTPRGEIDLRWSLRGTDFHLELTVPPTSDAEVRLPDGSEVLAGPGRHSWVVLHESSVSSEPSRAPSEP